MLSPRSSCPTALTNETFTPNLPSAAATLAGAPPGYGIHVFTCSFGTPRSSAKQSVSRGTCTQLALSRKPSIMKLSHLTK